MPNIITKYLKEINAVAFEKYSIVLTELIDQEQGVYALYKGDKLYYIGKAIDLERRIKYHLRDRHAKKWDTFSIFIVNNEKHIDEIEALLIAINAPKGNSKQGMSKAKDLKKSFSKATKEYDEEQRQLVLCIANKYKKSYGRNFKLYATYKNKKFKAVLLKNRTVKFKGKEYSSPSAAGVAAIRRGGVNGLLFWKLKDSKGNLTTLKDYFSK